MPQFAIVIPNLNQSRFLADALESLKHQNVRYNLGVMDGGSSDGFNQVVQKYSDIITYMRSCPDGGQARAIADGSELITGDIVSWLNADDYYFPGALDKVADFFDRNPDVDVVYGDAVHVNPDGKFISYFPAIEAFDAKTLPFSCFICQPACFVRRRAYNAAGGINPALKYTMDWDLWCRLAVTGARFEYLHDALAAVRYYPETKTLSGDKQRYLEIWRIGKKYGRWLLPVSWPAFYRFDLSFKREKTAWENLVFHTLERARKVKKKIFKQTQKTLYGFYPWQPRVDGRCLIQFPWYGDRELKSLCLAVSPPNAAFRVEFDAGNSEIIYSRFGKLCVNMPKVRTSCHKIGIKCLDQRYWEITEFL